MEKRIWAQAIYPLRFQDDGKENGDRKGPNNITKWSPDNKVMGNTISIPSYNRKITNKFPREFVGVCNDGGDCWTMWSLVRVYSSQRWPFEDQRGVHYRLYHIKSITFKSDIIFKPIL